MELVDHERASQRRYEDLKKTISDGKETKMTATTEQFFANPMGNGIGAGGGALAGGVLGYVLGQNGGLGGGGNGNAMTQIDDRFTNLQNQMAANSLREQGADSTIALGLGIAGVKDAVNSAASQNALALCGLGHTMQAGFASTNQTILLEGARTRELAQQTEINRLLALTAQQHSDAGHARTQVMLSQVISQGASSGN